MKRRRGYFKHYNDASHGESLRLLARNKDYLGIALYWLILEQCNQKNSDKVEFFEVDLCLHYNCKRPTLRRSYVALTDVVQQLSFDLISDKVCFQIANYTEYQEKRGQKTNKNSAKNDTIKDLKIKDKRLKDNVNTTVLTSTPAVETAVAAKQPSRFDALDSRDVISRIPRQTAERWMGLYPDPDWMQRELVRAIGWYLDNGNKKPKSIRGWCQALSSWLERGWQKHARYSKGTDNVHSLDWEKVFGG